MNPLDKIELCFPSLPNISCVKPLQHHVYNSFLFVLLSCICFLTVFLNLLVIISISHFRTLQTTTNLFLLSLAVSDLLVGLLLMPVRILLTEGCWFWGAFMCVLFNYMSFILTSASVGSIVFISADRYIAICDPLSYPIKVTPRRVKICICLCWTCSVCYTGLIIKASLSDPNRYISCHGECVIVIDYLTGAFDLFFTFFAPITVIIVLYMRVFAVAVSQARAMRSHITAVTLPGRVHVTAKKSEKKAATALGVVVVVFLICYCPYFYPSVTGQDFSLSEEFSVLAIWLLYCNSCLNPIIYAFFYPWFRKSVRLIVTIQILQPGSSDARMH